MESYRDSHLEKSADYDQDLKEGAFDAYMATHEAAFLRRNIPILFPGGLPSYLDFACGTGRITSVVEGLAERSYGVDVSESMQAVAKAKCKKTTFFLQDITQQPLDLEPVDLVTAFRFFGNAEEALRLAALQAISRQMASGGYLIANNHRNPLSPYVRLGNLRGGNDPADLAPGKFEAALRAAGFSVQKVFGLGWWFIHSRMNNRSFCESAFVSLIDPLSRIPGLYRYCPDCIVVARKD